MAEAFGRWMAMLVAALIVGVGFMLGIGRAGSALADKIPDMPDLPSVGEIVETVAESEPYEDLTPAVLESIRALSHLTTVEYIEHTTIDKGTDASWLSWARGDSIQMFAVAKVGAGVDLAALGADAFAVDTESGIVTVQLPDAEIHYAALDNDATQVFDRKKGLFTKGDPQLETEARLAAEQALLDAALQQGILAEAEARAADVLRTFVTGLGYSAVEFEVAG